MEKLSVSTDKLDTREVTPLDQARFVDKLDPEYEQKWDELLEKARETKLTFDEILFPIWLDESFPRAIRDRVMLLSMGKRELMECIGGPWGGSYRGSFRTGHLSYQHRDGYEQEYNKWIDDAVDYGDIINHASLFHYSYRKFESGVWDQDKFEKVIGRFNPLEVQPTSHGGVWDDPGTELDRWRLPYIDDILNNITAKESDTKLKTWAQDKLDLYRDNYITDPQVLPSWLQNLYPRQVMNFVVAEYKKLNENDVMPENMIQAFALYGFDYESPYNRNDFRYRGSSLLNRLDELPQELLIKYLTFRYSGMLQYHGELPKNEEDLLLSHITGPLPGAILELQQEIERLKAKARKESAEHQKKYDDEKRIRQERETRQAKLTQQALSRYNESLNNFRIGNES